MLALMSSLSLSANQRQIKTRYFDLEVDRAWIDPMKVAISATATFTRLSPFLELCVQNGARVTPAAGGLRADMSNGHILF